MKKEITTPTTRYVTLCDLCQKDASNGYAQACWLCRRDACYQCRTLLFAGRENDLIEFAIHVCKACQAGNGELLAQIQGIMADANRELRMVVDCWRNAIKGEG